MFRQAQQSSGNKGVQVYLNQVLHLMLIRVIHALIH